MNIRPRLSRPAPHIFGIAAVFCLSFALVAIRVSVPVVAVLVLLLCLAAFCLHNTLVAAGALLFSMLLSPEIRLLDGIVLRGEDLVIPVLLVVLVTRAFSPRFRLSIRFSRLDGAVAGVVAANLASSVFGFAEGHVTGRSALLWNLKIVELFAVYWVIFNYVREPAKARTMVYLALVVLVVITVIAFIQIPGTEVHTVHRLTAPFEGTPEPTTLGGYLLLQLAIVLSMALHEQKRALKFRWSLLAIAILIPILFTLSRTTYVATLCVILFLGILARRWRLILACVAGLSLSPLLLPAKIVDRVMMTFNPGGLYGVDSSLAERIGVWNKAWNALRERPLLGYGLPQPILDSQFARTIIESGILGLLAWIVLLVACIRAGLRLHRRATEPFHRALGAAFVVGTIGLVVHGLATITFYIVRIMEPFWFLAGIVLALDAWYAERERDSGKAATVSSFTRVAG